MGAQAPKCLCASVRVPYSYSSRNHRRWKCAHQIWFSLHDFHVTSPNRFSYFSPFLFMFFFNVRCTSAHTILIISCAEDLIFGSFRMPFLYFRTKIDNNNNNNIKSSSRSSSSNSISNNNIANKSNNTNNNNNIHNKMWESSRPKKQMESLAKRKHSQIKMYSIALRNW